MRSFIRSFAVRIALAAIVGAIIIWSPCSAQAQSGATGSPAAPALSSKQPTAAVNALYVKENAAIAARDYAKFVAPGTATFKKMLTKQLFDGACAGISDNVKSGYTSQFAGQRTVQGSTVYVWNLTCKNGVKYRVIMAMTASQIAGYLYQPPAAAGQ